VNNKYYYYYYYYYIIYSQLKVTDKQTNKQTSNEI